MQAHLSFHAHAALVTIYTIYYILKQKYFRHFMKMGLVDHWWTFSVPEPSLLYLQILMVQENGYLFHIWMPGSWPLLFLQAWGAADLLGCVFLQLHVWLHSLKYVHLDPVTVGSAAHLPDIYSIDALRTLLLVFHHIKLALWY